MTDQITVEEACEILDGLASAVPRYAWRVVKAELERLRTAVETTEGGLAS